MVLGARQFYPGTHARATIRAGQLGQNLYDPERSLTVRSTGAAPTSATSPAGLRAT